MKADQKKSPNANIEKCVKIINELIETEESYVDFIKLLQKVFIIPIQKYKIPGFEDKPYVSLFASVLERIVNVNGKFLVDLHDCEGTAKFERVEKIADVFVKHSKLFTIYGQYSQYYGEYNDLIEETKASDSSFMKFFNNCSTSPEIKGQNLMSLMIMPVQRTPRYILLLKELAKLNPDLKLLVDAQDEIGKTALHVNEAVRAHEQRSLVKNIQNQFKGSIQLVGPNRTFIATADFKKISRYGRSQQATFHLFSDILVQSVKAGSSFK